MSKKKYSIFLVKTIHTMPIAAEGAEEAKNVVYNLIKDNNSMYIEMGFNDDESTIFKARKISLEKDIPKEWRGTFLFNQHDVDQLTVKEVLDGYHPDEHRSKKLNDFKIKLKSLMKKENIDMLDVKGIIEDM